MVWNTTNYKGEPITLYSQKEVSKYINTFVEIQKNITYVCNKCRDINSYWCDTCKHGINLRKIQEILKDS